MNVRIVCYEDVHKWIIGKFALKLEENLKKLGHVVTIGDEVDPDADINHHIIYSGYQLESSSTQTLMITHIDSSLKLDLLKKQLQVADMGICMSRETLDNLVNLGIPRAKLCYINPAHDGVIKPLKNVVGITCRVQEDGRKREYLLGQLAKKIDPNLFSFCIMGDGWDEQIEILRKYGFSVTYIDHFDYNKYIELIPKLDYYLYMGQDEGQMGFIDAITAGVPTIVTEQGYHLDVTPGISYGFNDFKELVSQFDKIAKEKKDYIDSVKYWTWQDYTFKHLDVWQYLINSKNGTKVKGNNTRFKDGLSSIEFFDASTVKKNIIKALKDKMKLFVGKLKHIYFFRLNRSKTRL